MPRNDDTAQRLLWKIASLLAIGLGCPGVAAVTGAGTYTGNFAIYHALTDTVITSVTYSGCGNSSFVPGSTVLAGDRIYGNFESLVIASGTGELYRGI